MKKILTGDGSFTFFNERFNETYHSKSGAKEESVKKFVEPCKIKGLAKEKGFIKILDVCFGLGYNSAAAIDAALEINPDCKLEIIGLEIDDSLISLIKDLNPCFKSYNLIQNLKNNVYESDNVNIKILVGDALETIKKLPENYFDVCFLDPFSPKKCPSLWSLKFFKMINSKLKNESLLSTYSCARIVRDNLKDAGFKVRDGPCVGRRAPSTIAEKP